MKSTKQELLASLKEMVALITSGRHYHSTNPYTRPEIKKALKTIQKATGFKGDWMDAMSKEEQSA